MFPLMFPLRNLFSNAARLPRPAVFNYRLHSVLKGDTTTPKLIGLHEIQRTKDLLERVAATNRPQEKKDIIAEYPDLRGVIDLTLDKHYRYNLKSGSVLTFISSNTHLLHNPISPDTPANIPLAQLLQGLQAGTMNTSHIVDFLRVNGLLEGCRNYLDVMGRGRNGDGSGGLTELQVFFRVLDKNMKVGFGTRLMKGVEKVPTEAEGSTIKPEGDETSGGPTTTSIRKDLESDPLPATMHLSPSLGKTILLPDLPKLFQSQSHPTWYASRKLDGVRCLVVVDVVIETTPNVSRESDSNVKVKFLRGQAYSRTGKAFATLGEVTQDIESVCDGWSGLATLLKDEPYLTYSDSEIDGRTASRGIKRFVLDGETCILRPSVEEGGALVEDFKEIVSLVRRKQGTIPNVSMFLLDLLPWGSFHPGDLRQDFPMRAKTFGDRLKDCAAFLTRMKEVKKGEEGTIRALGQNVVRCVEDVESLIGTAAEEGWEGLILRKDVAYEGKRTSNLRKYKAWMDAEYTVLDAQFNTMRLPIDGVYADRMALANVWIGHKGVRVSIGSGFTASQRLRFAEDPNAIIGKQITVEYFGESTSDSRDKRGGGVSLRFPRIKHIWEDGKRDI